MLLFSINTLGQENKLTPCADFRNEIFQIKQYQENLENILIENFKEDYIICFIAKPTFNPEYAFQIRKINSLNFKITAILFQKNLWYTQNTDSVKVNVYKRNIDKNLALQVDALFKLFTDSIASRKALGLGEDGVTFYFKRQTKEGVKCGETWSPETSSPLGELVYICKVLIDYTKGENVKLIEIEKRINHLSNKIK